jgi:ABC-type transporter Mla subunit MlaD
MAMMQGAHGTVLFVAIGLFVLAVVCFVYAWWSVYREKSRYYSYKPLDPEEDHED